MFLCRRNGLSSILVSPGMKRSIGPFELFDFYGIFILLGCLIEETSLDYNWPDIMLIAGS